MHRSQHSRTCSSPRVGSTGSTGRRRVCRRLSLETRRALREKWKHRRSADPAARAEKALRRKAGQAQHRETDDEGKRRGRQRRLRTRLTRRRGPSRSLSPGCRSAATASASRVHAPVDVVAVIGAGEHAGVGGVGVPARTSSVERVGPVRARRARGRGWRRRRCGSRARAVCARLRRSGVHVASVARSDGESRARASNVTAGVRALNRRVELRVEYR